MPPIAVRYHVANHSSGNDMILRPFAVFLLGSLLASANAIATSVPADETPIACDNCADMNQPQAPFHVYGNTWYVGTHGVSSVLIVTRDGMILFDGDLPQSAPQIVANIRTLGFKVEDVRWILNSHAHFDHAGGIAALQRISGANVAASALGAATLNLGILPADDPQAGFARTMRFPAVPHVQALLNGETISLDDAVVTAHYTPGHTPGGTTWTWRSCERNRCVDIVYGDSLNPISAPGFRFSDPSRHPTTADALRRSITTVRDLPCDVLISVHPEVSGVLDKAAANARDPSKNAFIDPGACRAYADAADKLLDARLKEEGANAAH